MVRRNRKSSDPSRCRVKKYATSSSYFSKARKLLPLVGWLHGLWRCSTLPVEASEQHTCRYSRSSRQSSRRSSIGLVSHLVPWGTKQRVFWESAVLSAPSLLGSILLLLLAVKRIWSQCSRRKRPDDASSTDSMTGVLPMITILSLALSDVLSAITLIVQGTKANNNLFGKKKKKSLIPCIIVSFLLKAHRLAKDGHASLRASPLKRFNRCHFYGIPGYVTRCFECGMWSRRRSTSNYMHPLVRFSLVV